MANVTNNQVDSTPDSELEPARDTAGARLAAKRAAKAAQKASARGTAVPGEEVTKSLLNANSWLDDHKGRILGGVTVLALAGAGWLTYQSFSQSANHEAGALLQTAITTTEGIVLTGDEPASEDEPLLPTFDSAAERDKKALEQLRAVQSKFPSSSAAQWARMAEANVLLGSGKAADAQKAYAGVIANVGEDTFLHARAIEGIAYAFEAQNKREEAVKRFDELAKLDKGAFKTLADYHRGRLLAASGKREEAIKVLDGLVKASAAKPAGEAERFTSEIDSAKTLLEELGVKPAEKKVGDFDLSAIGAGPGGKGEISQQMIDALRKQIAEQQQKGAPAAPAPQGTDSK